MIVKIISIILVVISASTRGTLLGNLKICKRSDSDYNGCLKNAIQNALKYLRFGAPVYNIPTMEPLQLLEWTVPGSKSNPFQQKYKNIRLYNHATSIINELKANVTDTQLFIQFTAFNPMLKMVALYHYENALAFGVDISASGTLVGVTLNNTLALNVTGDVVVEKGIKKVMLKSIDLKLDIETFDVTLDHQHFEQSKQHTEYVTANAKDLYSELRTGYEEMFAETYKIIARSVFSQLDYDAVFPK